MKVCFPVSDLTSLRYFGPIIEFIKDNENIEVSLYFRRDCAKYNCLKSEKNYNIFKKIASSLNPAKIIPMTKSKIKCDVLFTIENVDSLAILTTPSCAQFAPVRCLLLCSFYIYPSVKNIKIG